MKRNKKSKHLSFEENKVFDLIQWGKEPIESSELYNFEDLIIPNRFDFGGDAPCIFRNFDHSFNKKPNTLFKFKNLIKDAK